MKRDFFSDHLESGREHVGHEGLPESRDDARERGARLETPREVNDGLARKFSATYASEAAGDRRIDELRSEIKGEEQPEQGVDLLRGAGRQEYTVDGVNIELNWRAYQPEAAVPEVEKKASDRAVIFIPGWGSRAESRSNDYLVQSLADESVKDGGGLTLSIDTRAEQVVDNSLVFEAEAIRRFVEENGIRQCVLSGFSQGGLLAVNTAVAMEKSGKAQDNGSQGSAVQGVMLYDPMGLYKQSPLALAGKFLVDSQVYIVENFLAGRGKLTNYVAKDSKHNARRWLANSSEVVKGSKAEAKRSGLSYLARTRQELAEMATANECCQQLEAPVVLIQGTADLISNPQKTVEEADRQLGTDITAMPEIKSIKNSKLAKTLFPKSVHVNSIEAENLGRHGLPMVRSEEVARAGLYLLRRFWRESQQKAERQAEVE